jgi:uncharacterized membrane protein YhiD involved in acid resistance
MYSSGGLGFSIGPAIVVAALLTLIPFVAAAFASEKLAAWVQRLTLPVRLL